ncbi:MAG: 2-hydroxychromene-2-carboxylate isomerase [Alphaproteobacteria bacterium]|nr:2-hydroxychromene-2-carboxylate isomerase [Alphaproteobacteria bacterium]
MNPEFLFDVASPNAYFAHRVIPQVEARTGTRFVYRPVLLGGLFKLTNNQAPMIAFAGVPKKLAYEALEIERFITRHQLTKFRMNPHFPLNTLGIMRTCIAAELEGDLMPFVEAAFALTWEEGIKLDDPAIMAGAMRAKGIPIDRLMARAQEPDVKQRLLHNTEEAAERGAFGIPTFFVGNEIYFGKDRFTDVEEEIRRAG